MKIGITNVTIFFAGIYQTMPYHQHQVSPIQSDEGNHHPGIKIVRLELNIEELRKSEEAKRMFQWSIQRFFQSAENQELGQYNMYYNTYSSIRCTYYI